MDDASTTNVARPVLEELEDDEKVYSAITQVLTPANMLQADTSAASYTGHGAGTGAGIAAVEAAAPPPAPRIFSDVQSAVKALLREIDSFK